LGADALAGGEANDRISGSGGADRLYGNGGNDVISGGSGNDVLMGQAGNDIVNGGTGNDHLFGGEGRDRFNFSSIVSAANADRIRDFSVANDAIGLHHAVFKAVGSAVTASEFHTGNSAHDTTDRLIYNKSSGVLLYDADGMGSIAAHKVATLGAGLALTYADFLVI
jgi:serralysin